MTKLFETLFPAAENLYADYVRDSRERMRKAFPKSFDAMEGAPSEVRPPTSGVSDARADFEAASQAAVLGYARKLWREDWDAKETQIGVGQYFTFPVEGLE